MRPLWIDEFQENQYIDRLDYSLSWLSSFADSSIFIPPLPLPAIHSNDVWGYSKINNLQLYSEYFKSICTLLGLSTTEISNLCKVDHKTVHPLTSLY